MKTEDKKNSSFFKVVLFIGAVLVFLFGVLITVNAYDLCSDVFNGFFCAINECDYTGQVRCYDSTHKQICGDYDSDSVLEWSNPKSCLSNHITSCGYKKCEDDEKPSWRCSNGKCIYKCEYSPNCPSKPCECSKGSCCDGCYYKPSTSICDFEVQTQYGCPWGSDCGVNVGKRTRTRFKHCSGKAASCPATSSNWLAWTNWKVIDICGPNEICKVGNSQCQYSSNCLNQVPEPQQSQAVYTSPEYDNSNDLIVSILGKKEGTSPEWKKEIKASPGETVDFLLIVANSSQENFDDLTVKAEIPQDIIYKSDLKIGENSSEENITEGFNIGSFPSGTIKIITFKGEVSSEIKREERNISGKANIEDLAAFDSMKIVLEEPQKQIAQKETAEKQTAAVESKFKSLSKKSYFWILLIFGIIVLGYLIGKLFKK